MMASGNVLDFSSKVLATAWKIKRTLAVPVELADLYQAGWLGLLKAWQKFDPARRVPFATYATFRIRGAMLDSLRQQDYLSRNARRRRRRIDRAEQRLSQATGSRPSDQEVAQACGETLETVGWLRPIGHRPADFAALSDSSLAPAEHLVYLGEVERLVARAHLPGQQALLLQLHYWNELPLKSVGRMLGVSESRASQIHSAAIQRLRGVIKAAPPPDRRARVLGTA